MNEDRSKVYQTWLGHTGMTVEALEKEFQEILAENAKEHPEDNEQIKMVRTLARQQAYHSQQFKAGGKQCECIIIGAGTSYDPYKAERKDAIEKGFVNAKGEALFFSKRFEWKFKEKDGSIKEVVVPSEQSDDSCSRRAYVVAKIDGQESWKPGLIFLNGRRLCNSLPSFYTPTKVKLGIKDDKLNDDILSFNSTASTKFIVTADKPIDFKSMSESLLPKNFVPFEELPSIPNSDSLPLGLIITSGTVTNINLTKDEVKSNIVEIMKTSKTMEDFAKVGDQVVNLTLWVSKDLPIKFGVGSEIMVVTQKSIRLDKEGKDTESYNVAGIYPIYSTSPDVEIKPIVMQEAEEEKTPVEIITPSQAQAWRGEQQ